MARKVLIVVGQEDPLSCTLLSCTAEDAGYEVQVIKDEIEAIKFLEGDEAKAKDWHLVAVRESRLPIASPETIGLVSEYDLWDLDLDQTGQRILQRINRVIRPKRGIVCGYWRDYPQLARAWRMLRGDPFCLDVDGGGQSSFLKAFKHRLHQR